MKEIQKTDSCKEFMDLILKGVECWVKAGEIVAQEVDKDPNFIDTLCEKYPQLSPEYVRRFEDIGRKRIHPQLLLNGSHGARKLCTMPIDLQEKYLQSPIDVMLADGNQLKVDVRNLTYGQTQQVFTTNSIRSLAGQRSWLEDKRSREIAPVVKPDQPYRIVNGSLVILEPCTIARKDLAAILSRAL